MRVWAFVETERALWADFLASFAAENDLGFVGRIVWYACSYLSWLAAADFVLVSQYYSREFMY